jgi:thioredoxin
VLERPEPVIVKFGAEWCGPCRMLDPELDRLAGEGRVSVVKIDVDKRPDLSRHFGVSSIPDVYLFNKGAPVAHQRGYTTADRLQKWINAKLAK